MECCELGFHLHEVTSALKKAALNLLESHGADRIPSSILSESKVCVARRKLRWDAPEGQALLQQLGPAGDSVYLQMALAYEGNEARALTEELG